MNIMYCGDSNTFDGIVISLLSIVKHTNDELHIYILTMNFKEHKSLNEKDKKIFEKIIKEKNNNSFVKIIDMQKEYESCVPYANIDTRFTPYCMLRLYSDLIELPEKILYLDYDVVCNNDFNFLYNMENNYEIVGVLDYYGSHIYKKNIFKKDYINSGVLLLNMKLIKENKLFEKCRKMCQNKKMLLPDQSALNKLCTSKKIIDSKYNEQHKMHDDTVFRHFTTTFKFFPVFKTQTIKPWHIDKLHNILNTYCFDDILEQYKKIKEEV